MHIIIMTTDRSGSINIVGERWMLQLSSSAVCTIACTCKSSVSAEMFVTARPSKSESTESPVTSS